MYTKEEQKENRKKWVAALRSGEYKQTTNALRNDKGFCCLGVACDISGLGGWGFYNAEGEYPYSRYNALIYLPNIVRSWLGLHKNDGEYDATSLTEDNDAGRTFQDIADIVESEPEGLLS